MSNTIDVPIYLGKTRPGFTKMVPSAEIEKGQVWYIEMPRTYLMTLKENDAGPYWEKKLLEPKIEADIPIIEVE
jgi:hypothetical protein